MQFRNQNGQFAETITLRLILGSIALYSSTGTILVLLVYTRIANLIA